MTAPESRPARASKARRAGCRPVAGAALHAAGASRVRYAGAPLHTWHDPALAARTLAEVRHRVRPEKCNGETSSPTPNVCYAYPRCVLHELGPRPGATLGGRSY